MWCNANIGDRPAMQLMSDWWVTNPEKEHLYILRAEVRLWRGLRKYVFNQMQLIEKGRSGVMDEVRLLLFIEPRFCNSEAESFSATVVMIDNFNRRHHVGKVLFRGVKAPQFPA